MSTLANGCQAWVLALRATLLLLFVFGLTACSGGNIDDLKSYVEEVKMSRKGRVPPLPEFIPAESYVYSVSKMGDPYVSWQDKAAKAAKSQKKANAGEFQPDLVRRREPLESFPLDTLRMVGTLDRENENSVLIKSPDGLISRVVVGNYIGQNHGRVLVIHADKVDLTETVSDGLGGWQRRLASMAIVE